MGRFYLRQSFGHGLREGWRRGTEFCVFRDEPCADLPREREKARVVSYRQTIAALAISRDPTRWLLRCLRLLV
jgi:hypothetical protein